MGVKYNVYFEVSSALFMIFLAFYVRWQYNMNTSRNKSFFRMLILVIFANILDVATALMINNANIIPPMINMIANTIYYVDITLLSAQFLDYSFELTQKGKHYKLIAFIEQVLSFAFFILLLLNIFTGIMFDFDNGMYNHGSLYLLGFIVPYLMLLSSAGVMFYHMRSMDRNRQVSIVLYYVVSMSGVVLQLFFFPYVLLTSFTISISVMIILFALETQDYQKLVQTLEEMRVLNEHTQKAIEEKRQFIGNVSTNVRIPAKRLLEIDEILLDQMEDGENKELLAENQMLGFEMLGILDDILEYSEDEIDKIEICEKEYNVRKFIENCVCCVKKEAQEKGIKLEADVDDSLPISLVGDRDHITQIVRLLLINAVKYTDIGKVTLRVTWKEHDRRHVLLLISIEDTGCGIAEDKLKNIFEPAVNKDSIMPVRLTMGLAYAKKIVKVMNGDIGVYSKEGEGALFYVEFPQLIGKN